MWWALIFGWFLVLVLVPDPRPLGAPDWAIGLAASLGGLGEPAARAIAAVVLRGLGLGILGFLFALYLAPLGLLRAAPLALLLAVLAAMASQWLNYGYFPIAEQREVAVVSVVAGALAGFAVRRSRLALAGLGLLGAGLFLWVASTGISDDLYDAASATADHLLEKADEIPPGDAGFVMLLRAAFEFAEHNSHRSNAVMLNEAAILALGVILGEERVADVAQRPIDESRKPEWEAIRNRITLRGRNDLARHFWVSAALAVLADEDSSMAVGIGKEMMDAGPGGSGFSFVDLTADRAGILFAIAATRDAKAARAMQARLRQEAAIGDFCPEIDGLPEGMSRDEFQEEYGGLGGEKTNQIVEEIRGRLARCAGLAPP